MSPRRATTNQAMRDSSRRAILDAALAVFAEAGPADATTAAIAARAGVAKGLVFTYFASKDALLAAVIEDRLNEALQYWRDLPPITGTALLTHIAHRALDRAIESPEAFRLYFALFFQPGASAAVRAAEARVKPDVEAYYRVIATALKAAGSEDPAVDAVLFQAALNGLVQNLVIQPELARRPQLFPRERLVARLVGQFVPSPTGRPARRTRR